MENKTPEQLQQEFEKLKKNVDVARDGQKILQEENKLMSLLGRVGGEALRIGMDFFNMIKDYFSGEYKDIPIGTIIAIIVALLYFLNPVDLIPDFIPVIGQMDDVAMLLFIYELIKSDVEAYRKWKQQRAQSQAPQTNTN